MMCPVAVGSVCSIICGSSGSEYACYFSHIRISSDNIDVARPNEISIDCEGSQACYSSTFIIEVDYIDSLYLSSDDFEEASITVRSTSVDAINLSCHGRSACRSMSLTVVSQDVGMFLMTAVGEEALLGTYIEASGVSNLPSAQIQLDGTNGER